MKKNNYKKIVAFFLVFCLSVSILPLAPMATTSIEDYNESGTPAIVIADTDEAMVNIYEEDHVDSKILTQINDGSPVRIINKNEVFSLVEYKNDSSEETFIGYIETKAISEQLNEEVTNEFIDENEVNGNLENQEAQEETMVQPEDLENQETQEEIVDQPIDQEDQLDLNTNVDQEKQDFDEQDDQVEDNFVDGNENEENIDTSNTSTDVTENEVNAASQDNIKYQGIALTSINMYSAPSTQAKVLRTYEKGTVLKYYKYNEDWFYSSINVNGVWTTVYINKKDVETETDNPVKYSGIATSNPTNMYASPTKKGKVLKSAKKGALLKYYTFTSEWYRSSVEVNGKWETIYIYINDVENITENPVKKEGIALKSKTNMYSLPSDTSKVIRSYPVGTVLKYYTFTSGWYKSSINVNGTWTTIYINADDVEERTSETVKKEGIAITNANMYEAPSTSSKSLRTYQEGTILKFYTFTKNWYKSNITVNGKQTTIYIQVKDVELIDRSTVKKQGFATKSPTNVYLNPSKRSKVMRSYPKGNVFKFYDFSANWYVSNITVNGSTQTIYIHKADVSEQLQSNYSLSLADALSMQMKASPQTDVGSKWVNATRDQVLYYLNPNNFLGNTEAYLQFLVLSSPAGTDINEVNKNILYNKGVLHNQAASFKEAANKYNINEIYLISHALLETGNGTSALAKGIKYNGVTVYNCYGVGALDADPDGKGAEYAYKQGWTTIEKAIIGGAKFVAQNYIHAGQDTLYKMRWNPLAMANLGYAHHQYATDIGWAVKQTKRMAQMYSQLTIYSMLFDVPVYTMK